jgi:hypothetical protein
MERTEDILTSNVFGLLRYLPAERVLFPWLRTSQPFVRGEPALLPPDAHSPIIELWPRARQREIDLCLLARTSDAPVVVGIECKLESRKSPATSRPVHDPASVLLHSGDQLADYWDALLHDEIEPRSWSAADVPRRVLLYLTADIMLPKDEFKASLSFIRPAHREAASRAFYWCHWQSLPGVLNEYLTTEVDPHRRLVASDLLALLERKELVHFKGFRNSLPSRTTHPALFRRYFSLPVFPVTAQRERVFYLESASRTGAER